MFILYILIFIFAWIMFEDLYYNTRDHFYCFPPSKLSPDAQITDISSNVVGFKGTKCFRTNVTFSDGSRFVSHKTWREDYFSTYKITLTELDREMIVMEAKDAHHIALCRYNHFKHRWGRFFKK